MTKKRIIKLLISLSLASSFSILHTLFLNRFFLGYTSINAKYYIKALLSVFPHIFSFTGSVYLTIGFSFLLECIVWSIVYHINFKDLFHKDNKPLYGTSEWAIVEYVKERGYAFKTSTIFTKLFHRLSPLHRSLMVVGQSEDAVFIQRYPNKEEKQEIKDKYEDDLNSPDITDEDKAKIKDDIKTEKKTLINRCKKSGKHLIGASSFANILTIGGVGSCKTQSTIIPTLLSWKESVLVNDPKGELFKATAGYRSKFSDVYWINPLDLSSTFTLNFLDWIPRDKASCIASIQRFTQIAVPPDEKEIQKYFNDSARSFLQILLLDIICYGKTQSVGEAYALLNADVSDNIKEYCKKIYKKTQDTSIKLNKGCEEVRELLIESIGFLLKEHENTFTNIASTLRTKLQIFSDPRIITLSTHTSIKPEQFQQTKRPISIYITTPTSDVDRCKDFICLIFSSILIKLSEKQLSAKKRKNRMLFVLDEFFQLGTMDEIYKKIPIARGYGIHFMIAVQSIAQLYTLYGQSKAREIFENMTIKDIKQVGEEETATWVKKMLGTETIIKKHKSISKSRSGNQSNTSVSTQESESGRDLMTEQEIMGLPYDEQITIIKGLGKPYKSKKVHAFEDERYSRLMNLPFAVNNKPLPLFDLKNYYPEFYPTQDDKKDISLEIKNNDIQKEQKAKNKKQKEQIEQPTLFDELKQEIITNTDKIKQIDKTLNVDSENNQTTDDKEQPLFDFLFNEEENERISV